MPPSRPRAGASVDYSSKDYWTSRFEHENHFEWLSSSSLFLPHFIRALDDLDKDPLQIIHIGCGNSELSLDLRQCVSERPSKSNVEIINVDYAAPALERMRMAEIARFGDTIMRWEVLDLLDWEAMRQFLPMPQLSVVLDKSCADAIACGDDMHTALLSGGFSVLHPVKVLALHLAALVAPGSIWLAVSYSSSRLDILSSQDEHSPAAGEFWQLERTERILAQTETRDNVYTPEVYHTLFVLRRTRKILK
ncbi:methyltransferase domain protein [Ceratobasidium sp. AG-Ba]|nr:methyltransferase domain protein [Ceratobasidium sp. AG-Ba]QRW04093.1 methyltransferase domain protein [Ceratobasidium sp. AG-Ba]